MQALFFFPLKSTKLRCRNEQKVESMNEHRLCSSILLLMNELIRLFIN